MSSESEQSILNSLEHLIFDEHKIISYKWITNHFKIQIANSKKILSKFVNQHNNKLFITHCITGYKQVTIQHPNAYNSQYKSPTNNNKNMTHDSDEDNISATFTILIVSDSELKKTKSLFTKICSIHIHSISIKESAKIKDFYAILYENDYKKQLNQVTNYLSQQTLNNNNNNNMETYSNLMNGQVKTVSSPQLHRALQRTQNKNIEPKPPTKQHTFNEKIAKLKKGTPLKQKFNKLEIDENKTQTDSKSASPNSNAHKNKNNAQNAGIEACFAKAAVLNKSKPQKTDNSNPNASKKKKGDNITNFFGVESKTKPNKKRKKKKKKKKSKSKKNEKMPIKAAKKRKRGEMEESKLIPIEFDSESSECQENEYGVSDDEELEGIKRTFKTTGNSSKRRKIAADSEEENGDNNDIDDGEDEDIDLNDKKTEKQAEKDKLLNERKKNFFGKAKGNKMRKMKKQKKTSRSYIDENGMFVTEDIWVSDNDNDGNDDGKDENVHLHQNVTNNVCDDDDDVDMVDKENSTDNQKKKEKKARKVVKASKKGKKKSGKRDGNITNFFKTK